jgi:hypothetical protein
VDPQLFYVDPDLVNYKKTDPDTGPRLFSSEEAVPYEKIS